jgi:hypothetical protein
MHRSLLASLLVLCACGGSGSNATSPDGAPPDGTSSGGGSDGLSDGEGSGSEGGDDATADTSAPGDAGDAGDAAAGGAFVEDTSDGIHAFLTFDYGVTSVATAAPHAVFVWGADQGHVATYRASSNPKITLSSYIPWRRDPDGTHDLAYWKGFHPDWVVYQCDQTTPAFEGTDPNVPLDISNPAVLAWQVQTFATPASAAGYDAIAADNYDLSNAYGGCGVFVNGTWKALYAGVGDPKFTADAIAWAHGMRTALKALARPLGLVPNFTLSGRAYNDPNIVQVVANVDGILDEGGYTRFGSGYSTGSEWQNIESFVEYVQAQGRAYFSINETSQTPAPQADADWALASYLMSKEHASALYVSGVQQYGGDMGRPEYAVAIGPPCGAMQAVPGGGAYVREFKTGIAVVNPSTSSVTYTVPAGSFVDETGQAVTGSLSLGAHSGAVLVQTSGTRC